MVVIKDMEMPKCCNECPLFHYYLDTNGLIHYICKCGNKEMFSDLKDKRNDFCPLIESEDKNAEGSDNSEKAYC